MIDLRAGLPVDEACLLGVGDMPAEEPEDLTEGVYFGAWSRMCRFAPGVIELEVPSRSCTGVDVAGIPFEISGRTEELRNAEEAEDDPSPSFGMMTGSFDVLARTRPQGATPDVDWRVF